MKYLPAFPGPRATAITLLIVGGLFFVGHEGHAASRLAKQRQAALEEEQVDHLSIAAMLIQDAHFERALVALSEVDPKNDTELDPRRFYTLRGLAQLKLSLYEPAIQDFEAAFEYAPVEALLYVYAAQAHVGLGQFEEALHALDSGGSRLEQLEGAWLLRARCNWELKQYPEAWRSLGEGYTRFPQQGEFLKQQVFLLIDMQLFQRALEIGEVYLDSQEASPDAYVAFAEALRRSGEYQKAQSLLEAARLRFPQDVGVHKQLAYSYLDAGLPLSAGAVMEIATQMDPTLASEAAECYRQANKLQRALYMNAQVPDAREKARQRLGLLLEAQAFEQAAALDERLKRLDLLEDDRLKYALAYAYFKLANFAACDENLGGISDPVVFQQAIQLRQALEACQSGAMGCE